MFSRAWLPLFLWAASAAAQPGAIVLNADERGAAVPLPRPWAGAIEGGPIAGGQRSTWLDALRAATQECGFSGVALDDLFAPVLRMDEGYIYADDVLDRVAALNVRPVLELRGGAPAVGALARHVTERYNITDVRQWRFELQADSPVEYAEEAAAVRKADGQLAVGLRLPASALNGLDRWLAGLRRLGAPLDFLSLVPGGDPDPALFSSATAHLRRAGYPAANVRIADWPSRPVGPDFSRDEMPLAVYLLKANLGAPASVGALSYWRLCDEPEDPGPLRGVLHGGPGLLTFQGLVKPAFHAYRYLNALGEDVLQSVPGGIVTRRRQSGRLVVLAYNYPDGAPSFPPAAPTLAAADRLTAFGRPRPLSITLTGLQPGGQILIEWVDPEHASTAEAWREMGSPEAPGRQALDSLRTAARAAVVEYRQADDSGHFTDTRELPAWGMLLLREL